VNSQYNVNSRILWILYVFSNSEYQDTTNVYEYHIAFVFAISYHHIK